MHYVYYETSAPIGYESDLAGKIYNILSYKYYWRHWLVVVYQDMHGEKNHWQERWGIGSTTVSHLHWKGRYNILVSSVSGISNLTLPRLGEPQ